MFMNLNLLKKPLLTKRGLNNVKLAGREAWESTVFQLSIYSLAILFLIFYPVNYILAPFTSISVSLVMGFAIGIFLHRGFVHKQFQTYSFLQKPALFIASMVMFTTSIRWSFAHMYHHKFVDTDQDPHNPMSIGLIGSAFPIFWNKFPVSMRDMLRLKGHFKDPYHKFMEKYFAFVVVGFYSLLALISFEFFVYFVLGCALTNIFVAMVNQLHAWGNPEGVWWSLISGGEGFHNKHHENMRDYKDGSPFIWFIEMVKKNERR